VFCHATPRNDTEIITRISPEERIREVLEGVEPDVIVHGHVHVRYDRRVGGVRLVNPGSVGLPYEGEPGAYWAVLGPDVDHRRSEYDVEAMLAEASALEFPNLEEHFGASLLDAIGPDEVTEYFENVARGT
jgi:diadenosine tetraphosphatase ApaH/serine/threonine PP2A family protein phosphatase